MERYINILYRLALFWAGAPPDTVTMLLAVLEHPDPLTVLMAIALWVAENVLWDSVVKPLFLLILGAWIWPRIPARYQRLLRKAWAYFLPTKVSEDEADHSKKRRPDQ